MTTLEMINSIFDYLEPFCYGDFDCEWLARHTTVTFDDSTYSMTIVIDNINDSDYKELRQSGE